MRSSRVFRPAHRSRGVAIVIVLSLIVLLTAILFAFFSRAVLDRQISSSSAGAIKTEMLARGALDEIVLDLKQEIAAGSTLDLPPTGTPNAARLTLYIPRPIVGNSAVSTVVPALVPAPTTSPSPPNPTNVLKRSVYGQPFYAGNYYDLVKFPPSNSASAVNSAADPSLDGRYVSAGRWNKPLLLDGAQLGGNSSQSTAVYNNYFAAPDWVLVTRGGPKAFKVWDDKLKQDADPANLDYVIGRYAYMIYDEGGLLDVNHAGFPASLLTDYSFMARGGRLGQVNLNLIPGVLNMDAIVTAFRNAKTAARSDDYKSYVFDNKPANPGFLRVIPGDQTFLSRQDLINYQQAHQNDNPPPLTADSLQYLTTFTREKNAPAFSPRTVRPKVQPGLTGASNVSQDPGNPNTYGQDDLFNPSLITTRNSTGASRMSQRFSLSRIALLSPTGPAPGASAADVKKYFGLVWDAGLESWIYTSPDGSGSTPANVIKFLKNIPGTRLPDFFETLQASIHIGSLGRDSDAQQVNVSDFEPGVSSMGRTEAQNVSYQVMQIGANIIDQADADGYPTVIQFGGESIAGIENIPYPTRIFNYIRRSQSDPTTIFGDYKFEVWNPHQILPATGPSPTEFQIIGAGGLVQLQVNDTNSPAMDVTTLSPIRFSVVNSSDYRSPVQLGGSFRVGELKMPKSEAAFINGAPHSTYAVQYQGPTGKWREYQKFRRVLRQFKPSFNFGSGPDYPTWFHSRVDPRTDRFGTSMNYLDADSNFAPNTPLGNTIRPDSTRGYLLSENTPFAAGIFTFRSPEPDNLVVSGSYAASKNSAMGTLADNLTTSGASYKDPDSLVRPADGSKRISGGIEGQPLATGNFASRPVILNRPFRSVGELGYVFRDLPFKSLDFCNSTSGDMALLDAFTVDDAEVVAGRININTRQVPVLTALLANAAKQEGDPTVGLSVSEAQGIAQALVTRTTNPQKGPLLDRTELVLKFGSEINYANPTNSRIKTQRETALRALAESANTRTWNLMIDVVAQSGRYPLNASKLSAFTVAGERRYWLHVAIDRYTGEIIEQQLEAADE